MTKLSQVLNSRNFLVSLVSIILGILSYNNISTNYTSDQWVDLFQSDKGFELIATLLLPLVSVGTKIFAKITSKTFDFGFLKSYNFISSVVSILLLIVGGLTNNALVGLIGVVVVQVVNVIFHVSSPVKLETPELPKLPK